MRARGGVAVVLATAIGIGGAAAGAWAGERTGPPAKAPRLQAYYTAPVLVRSGEPVTIPVDVVCATTDGRACATRVTVGAAGGEEGFRTAAAKAAPAVRFDLSAPAARAVSAEGASGVVRYYVRASAPDGRSTTLPAGAPAQALRFYVAGSMPTVDLPNIRFGQVREGTPVLTLPWGSGSMRAGIALGNEAAVLGPSAFDVDARGRVYVLDPGQHRLAVFDRGRLVRSSTIHVGGRSDVAVSASGVAYVLSRGAAGDRLVVTAVTAEGAVGSAVVVGNGIPGAIRTQGDGAYVYALPLDAWLPVPGTGATTDRPGPAVGMPIGDGRELLRVVREHSLRLGTVTRGGLADAVEVVSRRQLGSVPLVAPDGSGGYWAVLHVWRQHPRRSDQYQALHVSGGRVVDSFAMPRREFAQEGSLSTFRVGGDGALYQLLTGPAGMRIVRYEIGGTR
jgi:hypothetical protein